MPRNIYPLTVVKDRYNGVYSGGVYTAWNMDADEVPIEISCGDTECMSFWMDNDIPVGIGNTMQDAVNDLAQKLENISHKHASRDHSCSSSHDSPFKIIEDIVGEMFGDLQAGKSSQNEE